MNLTEESYRFSLLVETNSGYGDFSKMEKEEFSLVASKVTQKGLTGGDSRERIPVSNCTASPPDNKVGGRTIQGKTEFILGKDAICSQKMDNNGFMSTNGTFGDEGLQYLEVAISACNVTKYPTSCNDGTTGASEDPTKVKNLIQKFRTFVIRFSQLDGSVKSNEFNNPIANTYNSKLII